MIRLFPKGKESGRVFVVIAVGIFLIALALHWARGVHIENWVLFGCIIFAYMGGKIQDSALADGTLDKLTGSAVMLIRAIPLPFGGKRAMDRVSGPMTAIIVPDKEQSPDTEKAPADLTREEP